MIKFDKRTKSSFDVSIGTGLMLESLFKPTHERYDNAREVPKNISVDGYKYHFYNMMTLVRNIIGSLPAELPHEVILKNKMLQEVIAEEINSIDNLYTGTKCKAVFYLMDYDKLVEGFNKNKNREYTKSVTRNLDIFNYLKKLDLAKDTLVSKDFVRTGMSLPDLDSKEKALVTTSFSAEFINKKNFELMESHTGVLVTDKDFYKFYQPIGSRDMSIFPFNQILLYLIGDKNMSCIISPFLRARIHDCALEHKWTHRTGEDMVRYSIRNDKEIAQFLNMYKKVIK